MSTHASIAIVNADGSVDAVYCHFDGYLEGVGQDLVAHCKTELGARTLIDGGDMKSLDDGVPAAYKANGESWDDIKPRHYADLTEYGENVENDTGGSNLNYLWTDDGWKVWGQDPDVDFRVDSAEEAVLLESLL